MLRKIKLTQDKFAIIDEIDFELVSEYHWYFEHGYARCDIWKNNKKRSLYMHRLIMSVESGQDVHHINYNGLDNRRCNLQVCTHLENCQDRNRKIAGKGYHQVRGCKTWQVEKRINGRRLRINCKTEGAAKAILQELCQ